MRSDEVGSEESRQGQKNQGKVRSVKAGSGVSRQGQEDQDREKRVRRKKR